VKEIKPNASRHHVQGENSWREKIYEESRGNCRRSSISKITHTWHFNALKPWLKANAVGDGASGNQHWEIKARNARAAEEQIRS